MGLPLPLLGLDARRIGRVRRPRGDVPIRMEKLRRGAPGVDHCDGPCLAKSFDSEVWAWLLRENVFVRGVSK
eukprot:12408328-Prorocentrum_lima.AAC.1